MARELFGVFSPNDMRSLILIAMNFRGWQAALGSKPLPVEIKGGLTSGSLRSESRARSIRPACSPWRCAFCGDHG